MSDLGSASGGTPAAPTSRRGLKIVGAFALVLAIGGGAYGIASALGHGPSAATTNPSTTSPNATLPGGPGGRLGGGANGRFRARLHFGTVQSVAAHSFVVKSANGSSVSVEVSTATTFSRGTTGSASYAAVKVGTQVVVFGTVSGSSLDASRVEIVTAGSGGGFGGFGGFGPGAGSGTFGTVTSVGSNSFVVRTFAGSSVTVDVSSSFALCRARSEFGVVC